VVISILVYVIFKSVYKQNLIAAVVATRKTLFGKFATAAKSAAEEVKSDVVKSEQKPEAEPPK
jgi:hypothetical protein